MNGRLVLPFFSFVGIFSQINANEIDDKNQTRRTLRLYTAPKECFFKHFCNYTTIVRTYMKNHYAALLFCFNIHYLSKSWKMYNFAVAKHQR